MGEKLRGIKTVFEQQEKRSHEPDQNGEYDVIIIGLGVAGLSAAMYAARLGLKTLAIGEMEGGTVVLTDLIENYPGFVSIRGRELARLVENHAMDYDAHILIDAVDAVEKSADSRFRVSAGKKAFSGKTVVLATGAQVKKLGIKGEAEFAGRGVSYCALCELALAKGKLAVVVGGGDSAVKEASLLAQHAKKVVIVNNEPELHGEKPNMKKLAEHAKKGKIEVINSNEVVEISGGQRVEKITLKKPFNGKKELKADWVFVYAGRTPASSLARMLGARLNERQEVVVDRHCGTSVPGLYAAGDVTDFELKQVVIAAAQGVTAAYSAYKRVNANF